MEVSMALPIRTTLDDVDAVCGYLVTKPTGATMAEARAIVDKRRLDGRKLSALKFWGLIEEEGDRFKITEDGRRVTRDEGAHRHQVFLQIVGRVRPYAAIVERAAYRDEISVSATEVAAHWHEHFRTESSENDKILNDQAVCFFQVAQGADLGVLIIGRKGSPTRFEFDLAVAKGFSGSSGGLDVTIGDDDAEKLGEAQATVSVPIVAQREGPSAGANRVFITHGKNAKILGQVKEIVTFGKFEPIISQERETISKPVPDKVLDDMRSCQAAVIHVDSENIFLDEEGKEHTQINENVLIEIGAAMALYRRNFILLVEEGVSLPSNLQGLYECRYEGDELSMAATMKLLKAFNEFK